MRKGINTHNCLDVLISVSNYSGIGTENICGRSRKKEIVLARQVTIFECYRLGYGSMNKIYPLFNLKDHTSVVYIVKKVKERCETDPKFLDFLLKIRAHGKY